MSSNENMASREMRGGGFYTRATKGCFDVLENAKPLILDQLEKIPVKDDKPFVICDLGTADGGTSMPVMKATLDKFRANHPDKEVTILYEDQPTNDFKPLFLMTQGIMEGPDSYLKYHKKVFVHATGTSFYEQCAPTGHVDLEISSTAMHWLRTTPGRIENALHSVQATDEERKVFEEQAVKDWEQVLLQRAAELRSGGRCVFVNFCRDDDNNYLGNTSKAGGPKVNMHSNFNKLWRQMAEEGKITWDEYKATNFPQHYRTVEEYTKSLTDPNSPVYKAGLRLESADTKITRCPFAAGRDAGKYSSAEEFAKNLIPTLRSWSSGVFLTGLSDSRSPEEKQQLVDEFYGRYESEVAQNPKDHAMDFVHAYIVIRKE